MARTVIVRVTCDSCGKAWAEDDEDCPKLRKWSWNGSNWELEVCRNCTEKVDATFEPLRKMSVPEARRKPGRQPGYKQGAGPTTPKAKSARNAGRSPDSKYSNFWVEDSQSFECPYVTCSHAYQYPASLGSHMARTHGIEVDAYIKEHLDAE